jgi:fructokinase
VTTPGVARFAPPFALGIDLGGTKTEGLVLDARGTEVWRQRIATPSAQGYNAMLAALVALVVDARQALRLAPSAALTIGMGTPGSLTAEGLVKNANTQCLNGRALQADLAARLGQPVAIANDANCLALSEATDGAGAGEPVVFAAILGTGTGAGIAVHGRVLTGPNRLAGEWGHNPLPWAEADEARPACYCGQVGCVETLVSGPGLAADHQRQQGGSLALPLTTALTTTLTAAQIAAAALAGDAACADTLARWHQRLARALAGVINLLDPDVIVLGGGLSRIASTYTAVPALWGRWVFAGGPHETAGPPQGQIPQCAARRYSSEPVRTRLLPALHGDASGVRGAAWLGRDPRLSV